MTPHVRTAGRLGLFLLLAAASYVVAGPVVAMAGLDGFTAIAAYGAITALGLIAATAICIRVGRSTWHAAGVEFSRRRWLELAAGFLGGALLFAVVLLAQGVMAGERWQTNARVSPAGIVLGLAVVLALLLS